MVYILILEVTWFQTVCYSNRIILTLLWSLIDTNNLETIERIHLLANHIDSLTTIDYVSATQALYLITKERHIYTCMILEVLTYTVVPCHREIKTFIQNLTIVASQ